MTPITKKFVEIYVLDTEGREGSWVAFNKSYEEAVKVLDNWKSAAREVEKIFHPDTFTIAVRVLRQAERNYDGNIMKYKVEERFENENLWCDNRWRSPW